MQSVLAHVPGPGARAEPGAQDRAGARQDRRPELHEEAVGVEERHRDVVAVLARQAQPLDAAHTEEDAVGMRHDDALRRAGRARGVHDAGRVGGPRQRPRPFRGRLPSGEVDDLQAWGGPERVADGTGSGLVGHDEPGAAVVQLMGEERALEGGVDGHDDGTEPAEAQPHPDEVEAAGEQHGHRVAAAHPDGRESGRHPTRVTCGGGIRQRALPDDVDQLAATQLVGSLLEHEREHPAGHVVVEHGCQTTTPTQGSPCVGTTPRARAMWPPDPRQVSDTRASVSRMSLRDAFGTDVLVTGWGHTRFGRLDDESLEGLVVSAAGEALECAGVEPGQVDEIVLGTFNSGMWPLGFASSLALQVSDDLANVPATRVENACASGSAAVQQGVKSILAGTARTVLVIGAEKMTHAPADVVGAALLGADYELAGRASTTGFAGLFADVARHYEKLHGRSATPSARSPRRTTATAS